MKNKEALIVVDYQNDFADKEQGSLYVPGGETLAPIINQTMQEVKEKGGIVIASKDMHRTGNISFASNFTDKISITKVGPNNPQAYITLEETKNWTDKKNGISPKAGFTLYELRAYLESIGGKMFLWPDHCVVNTFGNLYYKDLNTELIDIEILKGYTNNQHPYSAYPSIETGTKRDVIDIIKGENIKKIKVVGLASDWCVGDSVIDLARNFPNISVEFLAQASRPVSAETYKIALEKMQNAGAIILP